jgi:hypothetical protein
MPLIALAPLAPIAARLAAPIVVKGVQMAARAARSPATRQTARNVTKALAKAKPSFGDVAKALRLVAKNDDARRKVVGLLRSARDVRMFSRVKGWRRGCQQIINTLNRLKRANTVHPKTKVPYNRNGFPVFKHKFEMKLPRKLYKATDKKQFREASKELFKETKKNPALRSQFTPRQMKQLEKGKTPSGHTWHHHESPGKMQLVNRRVHQKTGHQGGKSIWGGKR